MEIFDYVLGAGGGGWRAGWYGVQRCLLVKFLEDFGEGATVEFLEFDEAEEGGVYVEEAVKGDVGFFGAWFGCWWTFEDLRGEEFEAFGGFVGGADAGIGFVVGHEDVGFDVEAEDFAPGVEFHFGAFVGRGFEGLEVFA